MKIRASWLYLLRAIYFSIKDQFEFFTWYNFWNIFFFIKDTRVIRALKIWIFYSLKIFFHLASSLHEILF